MQPPQSALGAAPRDTPRDSREFAYELKFYVGNHQAEALKSWVRERLQADPHGGGPYADSYRVSSIYFDTQAFDVLARRGSFARSKYRVRRYNHGEVIYLERKTRGQYRVFKRRSAAALVSLGRLQESQPADWEGRWFHRRLLARALRAVSRVDYQRIARIGNSDYGPVRLTLDQELLAWPAGGLNFEVGGQGVPLSSQQLILELKFGNAMPAIFKELIREFSPRLEGISKYRLASLALGLAPKAMAAEPLPAGLAGEAGAAGAVPVLAAPTNGAPASAVPTNGAHIAGAAGPGALGAGTAGSAAAHVAGRAELPGAHAPGAHGLASGAPAAAALRRRAL